MSRRESRIRGARSLIAVPITYNAPGASRLPYRESRIALSVTSRAHVLSWLASTSHRTKQRNDELPTRPRKWRIDIARVRSPAIRIAELSFGARIVYLRMADAAVSLIGKKIAEHAAPINLIFYREVLPRARDFVRESVRFIGRGAPVFVGMVLNKNNAINTT